MEQSTVVANRQGVESFGTASRALLACVLLLASVAAALAHSPWPQVTIPKGVLAIDMGPQVSANGLPLRMHAFTSAATPAQVAELFRQSLGQPLVEDTVATKLILGRSQGEHYVTVQLEAAGTGTRGLIAVAELTAALKGQAASRNADLRLLARLPAGFSLVSRTTSTDGKNRAEHIVLTNAHSIALNAESVKSLLSADGFTFERETVSTGPSPRGASRDGRTLFFSRPGGEAVAVISRDDTGRVGIVLNTTTHGSTPDEPPRQ